MKNTTSHLEVNTTLYSLAQFFHMPRKDKLKRFAELSTFPNVVQNFDYKSPALINHTKEYVDFKGKWATDFFKNNNPIVLELACGKGDYTVGLARMFPKKNFIGIDIKGNRIWRGAKTALEDGLNNARFLRTKIELLTHFFAPDEVSEIWITFPDPQPKSPNRRLTAPHFLDKYRALCVSGATLHLKTDDADMYQYSLEVATEQNLKILVAESDIDAKGMRSAKLAIQTYYETQHLAKGKTIKYLKFVL
jgi:tRNA (guanine-N7-)-methyltransferase